MSAKVDNPESKPETSDNAPRFFGGLDEGIVKLDLHCRRLDHRFAYGSGAADTPVRGRLMWRLLAVLFAHDLYEEGS